MPSVVEPKYDSPVLCDVCDGNDDEAVLVFLEGSWVFCDCCCWVEGAGGRGG